MAQPAGFSMDASSPLLDVSNADFARAYGAAQPVAIAHRLAGHPLLERDAIASLADWLPRDSVICDTADQPLLVPAGGPPRGSEARPGDVIRQLETSRAWLTLLNIDQEPAYRKLMDECLDQVGAVVERRHGDVRRRVAFLFVSSPMSVTPAHFDIEHSLLLQVSGQKKVTVGRFAAKAEERRERERYWEGSHGRVEHLPPEDASYELTPGRGVYLPPVRPHWVHNGAASSISMTLTFFSADSERDQLIEAFNARARHLHLHPRDPGTSSSVDAAKATAMRVWGLRHRLIRGTAGRY